EWNQVDIKEVPAVQACSKILVAHGVAPITDWLRDFETVSLCDAFQLFLRSARAAGSQLTQEGFAKAAQSSGPFEFAFVHHSNYSGGKPTGGDQIAPVKLDVSGCKCFRLVGPWAPSYG